MQNIQPTSKEPGCYPQCWAPPVTGLRLDLFKIVKNSSYSEAAGLSEPRFNLFMSPSMECYLIRLTIFQVRDINCCCYRPVISLLLFLMVLLETLNDRFLSGLPWHIHAHRCTTADCHKINTWCRRVSVAQRKMTSSVFLILVPIQSFVHTHV